MKLRLKLQIIHKWKSFVILFIIIQSCPFFTFGQESFFMNIGVGNQGKDNVPLVNLELGSGYALFNNFNCFGGIKLNKYFLDLRAPKDNEFNETNTFLTANLYLGISNYFKILEFNKNKHLKNFGFFPELRFYFTPFLPRKINYEDNGILYKRTGAYKAQAAFGCGGGVYFKTNSGLIALKIELNSNDPFKVLRGLEYGDVNMPFSKGKQLLVGIMFLGF